MAAEIKKKKKHCPNPSILTQDQNTPLYLFIFIIYLGTSNSSLSLFGERCKIIPRLLSIVSGCFIMFLGQRQQFFTWKCNVREALNVKLAVALCNLAVSREEETPPSEHWAAQDFPAML